MIPLVVGVVMASFVLPSNAAQQTPTGQPLHERFFWVEGRPTLVIEKPKLVVETPESHAFTKLKDNEIQRAACRGRMEELLKEDHVPDLYKKELAHDGKLMEESIRLFNAYKKTKGIESPILGAVSEKIAIKSNQYEECISKAQIRLANAEHTINVAKISKRKLFDSQACRKELKKLFTSLHTLRIQAPRVWSLYSASNNRVVREQDITRDHLQAFKLYMTFDARFNELQTAIMNQLRRIPIQ